MGNLLIDHLHLEWIDVLILGRNEHARDTNDVQVADLPDLHLVLKVAVHQADRQEEGLVITLEVGEHLYVPVDHASTQGRRDLVPDQAVVREELLLKLLGIVQYRFSILSVHIDVLSFDVRGGSPQVSRWMSHFEVLADLVGAYEVASIQNGV